MINLPSKPGCYLFKDGSGKVIYVGKAKNLKRRVASYFNKKHGDKTGLLVREQTALEFYTTDNETEALVLENTLIKKHRPKYNINLKDSQRYAYILVTDERFPRLLTARDKIKKGSYYGPFVSGLDRLSVIKALRRTFKIRTCKKLPKRACLRFHIGLCDAPCIGRISERDYIENIAKAQAVLKGNSASLIRALEEQMRHHSSEKDFEKALILRDQINGLQYLEEQQKMVRDKRYDEDIINFIERDGKTYVMVFNVYKGTLNNKEEFVFDLSKYFLDSFVSQYYDERPVPKELIVPSEVDPAVVSYLEYRRGSKVFANMPQKGEKKRLLELVKKNIELSFFGNLDKVDALIKSLDLKFTPSVIECFDISHISGTSTTGSMVQFRNGLPDKNSYRRFRIRSYLGNDDFSGIHEVVLRRYKRLKEEGQDFPDLILIDGGKGQLGAAVAALKKLEVNIPVISIAKQFEEIFVPGKQTSIVLPSRDKGLLYLREIRDEAHRFAISYSKLLRSKRS